MMRTSLEIKKILEKSVIVIIALLLNSLCLLSQSNENMARANYYRAKQLFEQKNYGEAVKYVESAKKYLNNGTNVQLQYLHVIIQYNLGNFTSANTELITYFNLAERKTETTKMGDVEPLTNNETDALLRLTVEIQEKAASQVSQEENERRRVLIDQEIKSIVAKIAEKLIPFKFSFDDGNGNYMVGSDHKYGWEVSDNSIREWDIRVDRTKENYRTWHTRKRENSFKIKDISRLEFIPGNFQYSGSNVSSVSSSRFYAFKIIMRQGKKVTHHYTYKTVSGYDYTETIRADETKYYDNMVLLIAQRSDTEIEELQFMFRLLDEKMNLYNNL